MKNIVIIVIFLIVTNLGFSQKSNDTTCSIRVTGYIVNCKGKVKDTIKSIELTIIDAHNDTIYNGNSSLEFKMTLNEGYYKILAENEKMQPLKYETVIMRKGHVTFLMLQFRKRKKCGRRNRIYEVEYILE